MKKKALMKLLAVSIAASMVFTGCSKTDGSTSEISKESVVESVAQKLQKLPKQQSLQSLQLRKLKQRPKVLHLLM